MDDRLARSASEGADIGLMRCSMCRSQLMPSGLEPHRLVCSKCGQNFFLVMHLEPVDPPRRPALLEGAPTNVDRRTRTG